MRDICFYCAVPLQPGEPRRRMIWGLCTGVVHVACAGDGIYHLLHRAGEQEVTLTEDAA
jgi:hypothetical protein